MSSFINKLTSGYVSIGQKVGAAFSAPSKKQAQAVMVIAGVALVSAGLLQESLAQVSINIGGGGGGTGGKVNTTYNDDRIADAANALLTYMEGSFGALIMIGAGVTAIMSAAFGQYKAAVGALIIAIGAFILRSFLGTFFNDANIQA